MARKSRGRRSSQSRATNANPIRQVQRQAQRSATALQKSMASPFEPMGRMMQAFMPPFGWMNPWIAAAGEEHAPRVDVIERDGSVVVRAEIPGVQKSHLEVEASDMALTIKGEIAEEELNEEDEHYRLHETSRGVFERTVRLPSDVDSTRAKASFKDGILEVELPKVDRFKPHHVKF